MHVGYLLVYMVEGPSIMRVTAIDVETTGLDLFHGCRPYLVTICEDGNTPVYYEWPVDPLTREVQPDEDDLKAICDYINRADRIVGHNIRFDIKALHTVIPDIDWPWDKTFDTLLAAHIIASSMPLNLTDLCLYHLTDGKGHGLNILPLEEDLAKAVKKVRGQIKRHLPQWQLTAEGHEHMPSAKSGGKSAEEKMWKGDCWLLKALFDYAEAQPEWTPPVVETVGKRKRKAPEPPWYYEFRDKNHPYRGLLPNYANADSYVTHALAMVLWEKLQQNDLWDIYLSRLKILRPTFRMESYGFTIDVNSLTEMQDRFHSDVDDDSELLTAIAAQHNYELKLSKSGSNKNTNDFVFNILGLEPVKESKTTGNPSLDKDARTIYELTLPKRSEALEFIKAFGRRQSKLTGIAYMNGYHKHGIPISKNWIRLHPTFNPTGTNTLRWSCKNPNLANIAKKTSRCDECDGTGHITFGKKQVKCHECDGSGEQSLSLRYCFGPAPGREWWSMDYENIELRIPAYESGEESMIELFEHPDDPPYYGSYHLLNAGIIYPDEFWPLSEQKGAFKEKYKSTLYQWVKNFNFAVQYECQEATGDRAARKKGAFKLVKASLPKLTELKAHYVREATRTGYVQTIPDRTVNTRRGYPIMCSRMQSGYISPTVPFSYHVQSTAMQCTTKAMIRIDDHLLHNKPGFFINNQVHDELVFDFPKGTGDKPWETNLPTARHIQKLMEQSGEDIGIPLRVSVEYHEKNWAEGRKM